MPLRKKSSRLEERPLPAASWQDGPGGTAASPPPQTRRNAQAGEPPPQFASCLDVPECPTVNGLTWLLTCASLSQAGVRGHGNWGLAEEGRADGGKGVER